MKSQALTLPPMWGVRACCCSRTWEPRSPCRAVSRGACVLALHHSRQLWPFRPEKRDRDCGPARLCARRWLNLVASPRVVRRLPKYDHSAIEKCRAYRAGEARENPRKFFFYISDDGDILGIRMGDFKVVLMEQRAKAAVCWFEPFVKLRGPKMFNLRRDPFERADENSKTYWDWMLDHVFIMYENAGDRGPADPELRTIPAAPEAGRIQPRRGAPAHLKEASGSRNR